MAAKKPREWTTQLHVLEFDLPPRVRVRFVVCACAWRTLCFICYVCIICVLIVICPLQEVTYYTKGTQTISGKSLLNYHLCIFLSINKVFI